MVQNPPKMHIKTCYSEGLDLKIICPSRQLAYCLSVYWVFDPKHKKVCNQEDVLNQVHITSAFTVILNTEQTALRDIKCKLSQ